MNPLLSFAVDAARAAGALLLSWYDREYQISSKSSEFDLVTEADRASEALLLGRIREQFPDHGILAEESGMVAEGEAWLWIVDPLDGTTNFASRFPHFCVTLALRHQGQTQLGVTFDPLRDELFWAERGAGAWLESARLGQQRLHVRPTERLGAALLATGFAYSRATTESNNIAEFTRLIRRIRGVRRAGSAALDFAYVAAGRLDGYWEYHMQPWDSAAGALMVEEAGGQLCQLSGQPWHPWCLSAVAASPALMPTLLAGLRGDDGAGQG